MVYSKHLHSKKTGYSVESEPKQAIALGFDPNSDDAPRVLASGKGEIAERILEVAQANGVVIREDPVLAAALSQVDIDSVIPPELFALVAEVLAYVYRVQGRVLGEE